MSADRRGLPLGERPRGDRPLGEPGALREGGVSGSMPSPCRASEAESAEHCGCEAPAPEAVLQVPSAAAAV